MAIWGGGLSPDADRPHPPTCHSQPFRKQGNRRHAGFVPGSAPWRVTLSRRVHSYLPMARHDQFWGVLFKNGNLILKIIYE